MKRDAGFTLLEVMISMLIGTIGLMGTLAVQQSIIGASKNANDAAVAMRLATQEIEELSSRNTDTNSTADSVNGLMPIAKFARWLPVDEGMNSVPQYVDAEGNFLRDSNGFPLLPQPSDLGRYRWRRQWKVVDNGPSLPYVVSVIVTYNNDVGDPKTVRLDMERRKSW